MDIRNRLERAFKLILEQSAELPADLQETANAESRIYTGANSDMQKRPCVLIWARSGEEQPKGSGNRMMQVSVVVKSPATEDPTQLTDRLAEHSARVEAVLGIVKVDNLTELLNAAVDDFTVFDPIDETAFEPALTGSSFEDGITFAVYCCPSDV